MKYKWLNKKNNNKLIIFFNGWGMDEAVVNHLEFEDYDVVMFYDYNNLNTDFKVEGYENKYLISWSMGVMIATLFNFDVNFATAVNGTLKPIDENFGIHPKIYDLTIKGFNEKGRDKFINNMFSNDSSNPADFRFNINRELDNQKDELIAIKNYKANESFKYNRIIISDNDKIIPTKNQCTYWEIEPNFKSGHCPFLLFKKWSELL